MSARSDEACRRNREYMRVYGQRPEVRERNLKCKRAAYKRPDVREKHLERMRAYYQRPGIKERIRERMRARYHHKKAEREAAAAQELKMAEEERREARVEAARLAQLKSRCPRRFDMPVGVSDLSLAALARWPFAELAVIYGYRVPR